MACALRASIEFLHLLRQPSLTFLGSAPSNTIILDVSRIIKSVTLVLCFNHLPTCPSTLLCSNLLCGRRASIKIISGVITAGPSFGYQDASLFRLAEGSTILFLIPPRAARLQDNSPSRVGRRAAIPTSSIKVSQANLTSKAQTPLDLFG